MAAIGQPHLPHGRKMAHDGKVTDETIRCARYWRNTLADADLGQGAFRAEDVDAFERVGTACLSQGRLDGATTARLFGKESDDMEGVAVVIRPLAYRALTRHGRTTEGLPEIMTPILSRATLLRDGRLTQIRTTVVPRDLLEPLARGEFSIGTVDALDVFLTDDASGRDEHIDDATSEWQAYRERCGRLIGAVLPGLARNPEFRKIEGGYVALASQNGASRAIGALYDQIGYDRPDEPLFSTFCAGSDDRTEPCLSADAGFRHR